MQFLFISHSKQNSRYFNDPSARYRCIFPVQSLQNIGVECAVTHIDQVTKQQIDEVDVLIFHRPSFSKRFDLVLNWAKNRQKRILADYDDLLFALEESMHSSAVKAGSMSHKVAYQHTCDYLRALNCFTECITSTIPLANWVKKVSRIKETHVIPNRLPASWYYQTNSIPAESRFQDKVLRYLPGTSHHDGDFEFIKVVLTKFLLKHRDVTLEVIGPLRFSLNDVPAAQVRHEPPVPFDTLAQKMADSWICIAPLANSSFNECKSGLKFWESGLYGIPLVASPLADFSDFVCDGLIEAHTQEEWLDGLERLLDWDVYKSASISAEENAKRVLHGSELNRYLKLLGVDSAKLRVESDSDSEELDSSQTPILFSETNYYRVQQKYFSAWFGPGWMAYLYRPQIGVIESSMPGEAVDKATQLELLRSIWSEEHWASALIGEWSESKAMSSLFNLKHPPVLPNSYLPYMSGNYKVWQEWVDEVAIASQLLWQQQRQPVGSPLMRKWRKFRRSPKHFFEDSNNPLLKWFSRFF